MAIRLGDVVPDFLDRHDRWTHRSFHKWKGRDVAVLSSRTHATSRQCARRTRRRRRPGSPSSTSATPGDWYQRRSARLTSEVGG